MLPRTDQHVLRETSKPIFGERWTVVWNLFPIFSPGVVVRRSWEVKKQSNQVEVTFVIVWIVAYTLLSDQEYKMLYPLVKAINIKYTENSFNPSFEKKIHKRFITFKINNYCVTLLNKMWQQEVKSNNKLKQCAYSFDCCQLSSKSRDTVVHYVQETKEYI